MLFPFTVAALVTIFTTGVSGIINGLGTRIHDAPFAVMIFDRSDLQAFTGLICGGAIISRRYILTAAHCLGEPVSDNDVKYHHEWLRVMAGVSSYTCGIRTYEISNAFIHPDFTGDLNRAGSVRGDVAVLQLKHRLLLGDTAKRIALESRPVPERSVGIIYGWGDTSHDEPSFARILQRSYQKVFDFRTCIKIDRETGYRKDELCARSKHGLSFGGGDSGGPLVVNHRLVGIISNAMTCEGKHPGAFTNVVYYRSWIYETIGGGRHGKRLPFTVTLQEEEEEEEESDNTEDNEVY